MEKQWVAPHIGDTKTHAIQTLGVSIPQSKSRESCTPFLLKQLIQTPVKDGTRLISLKACQISQDALALACNIDRSYMGRIERGEVNVTVEKLYRIAGVLACDPSGLLPQVSELHFA